MISFSRASQRWIGSEDEEPGNFERMIRRQRVAFPSRRSLPMSKARHRSPKPKISLVVHELYR